MEEPYRQRQRTAGKIVARCGRVGTIPNLACRVMDTAASALPEGGLESLARAA